MDNADGCRVVATFPQHYFVSERDESFAIRRNDLLANDQSKLNGVVYEERDSELLRWFDEENLGVYRDDGVRHFVVATANEYIDVLCNIAPTIKEDLT